MRYRPGALGAVDRIRHTPTVATVPFITAPIAEPMSSKPSYPGPVQQLFQLGDPEEIQDWSTYSHLGIGPEHMADLARLAMDIPAADNEDDEAYDGPIHAWRTLAMLPSSASVAPLMTVLDQLSNDGNWWVFGDELIKILSRMGTRPLPELAAILADTSKTSNTQEHAIQAITAIYRRDRNTHADCVAVLTQQLAAFAQNDPYLNAGLVMALAVDLRAVGSAAMITQAYKANRVDESLSGSWEQVQVDLGLRKPSRKKN
jgi:hypothetical protein